jgi:hypothetical protein
MRTLVILFALSGAGCVGVSDYDRVRGELAATRDENTRLKDENSELHRDLVRASTKLDMIDMIIHGEGVPGWQARPDEPAK